MIPTIEEVTDSLIRYYTRYKISVQKVYDNNELSLCVDVPIFLEGSNILYNYSTSRMINQYAHTTAQQNGLVAKIKGPNLIDNKKYVTVIKLEPILKSE